MLSHIIRAALAGAAALGIASCAFGGAVSASYLGMGTSTGTPSGDVLAIINPHQRDRSPIISRDGGRVPDDGLERPEAVGQLNFQRPMRIAVHNEPGSEPDAEIIALIMLVIFLVLTYTTTLSILVRRRTRALRDALGQRDRIEAEAAQSRQHIANLERTGIVGQMSTIIAHELKQPLGAITNYGNGLLRRLGRGDVEREKLELALREIVLQAERASKIVERVRSYAKHDYPPRKVSDLSIIIENAIQTFRRSRTTDAELTVRMHPHSMAEVDGWEIELVVLNLLKNAADAISGIPDPKIEVCLYPSDEHTWILTVGDNGPYISDEQLSRFFKPLQTSKGEAGMGLGLSIVANIAERHAGNITVARNGSRGVKFTMTIPSQMKDVSVIADMGPETVSIYESGGNGRVAREVVERRGEEQADESPQLERSLPATVHTGTLNDAVHLMQDGDMHRTGRPRPPGIPGSKG